MLPAGEHVRSVYLGAGGVIANAPSGALLIDCSTIDVATARAVAAAAAERSFAMLDAPVSGGVGGAQAATLTFMVGGTDEAFARAQPILAAMGKTIVHAGGSGNGQAAKICNNMILGASMIAVSEGFLLAEKLGLDAQKLFDIASKSSAQCWSLTSLLSGTGAGADVAGQSRLSGRVHRGDDAQGPQARPGGGARGRRVHAAWSAGSRALWALRRPWPRRRRFFGHHPFSARQVRAGRTMCGHKIAAGCG